MNSEAAALTSHDLVLTHAASTPETSWVQSSCITPADVPRSLRLPISQLLGHLGTPGRVFPVPLLNGSFLLLLNQNVV